MQSFFRHDNYTPAHGFKDCEISSLLSNCCWGCRDAVLHTVASDLKRSHRMVIDQLRIDWIRFIFSLIAFWTNNKRVGLRNFDLKIIILVWLFQNHLKGLLIFQRWAISHCPVSNPAYWRRELEIFIIISRAENCPGSETQTCHNSNQRQFSVDIIYWKSVRNKKKSVTRFQTQRSILGEEYSHLRKKTMQLHVKHR